MGLINYESPDYQRLVQRTMASPLVRTNPTIQRKLMSQYTDNVMRQRVGLNAALTSKARLENEAANAAKTMGFQEREMTQKETSMGLQDKMLTMEFARNQINDQGRMAKLGVANTEQKWKEQDLNSQTWLGLLPAGYSFYEGQRRQGIMDQQTEKQNALLEEQKRYYETANRKSEPKLEWKGLY